MSVVVTVIADSVDSDPSDNRGTAIISVSFASGGGDGGGFCSYRLMVNWALSCRLCCYLRLDICCGGAIRCKMGGIL